MSAERQTLSLLEFYTTLLTEDFPFAKEARLTTGNTRDANNFIDAKRFARKKRSASRVAGLFSHKICWALQFDSRGRLCFLTFCHIFY